MRMGNHEPTYYVNGDDHHVRCTCGDTSTGMLSKQGAEDYYYRHERDIERVRMYLETRSPSLKQTRDYYQAMAHDSSKPLAERNQWQMLADEITARLGGRYEDVPLSF